MKKELSEDTDIDREDLNRKIIATGERLFAALEGEKPSLFEKGRWVGRMMDWSLRRDDFRTAMLRFVDVFPSLSTPASLAAHMAEYFGGQDRDIPGLVRWSSEAASRTGRLGATMLFKAIQYSIGKLGKQFILGETPDEAVRNLSRLRREGCAFSIDILGEEVVSESEADQYASGYAALLAALRAAHATWPPLQGGENGSAQASIASIEREAPRASLVEGATRAPLMDWGHTPKVHVSLKPSSLYSQTRPQDFKGSVNAILHRLRPIYRDVIDGGGALCIDMESHQYKDISLEVFRRLRLEFAPYPHIAIAMQAYLRDTATDLSTLVEWARQHDLPIAIRLVKGAYWDYEILRARQNGWPVPVYTAKADSDASFERLARLVLENHDIAYLACGSHNIRSIAAVLELARLIGVPDNRYEFQVLYGMAEPVRRALLKTTGRVRIYSPFGRIVPGMAYLVRRLLENTANQSFLRLMFAEQVDGDLLLQDPSLESEGGATTVAADKEVAVPVAGDDLPPFKNEPPADFSKKEERDIFPLALESVREKLGRTCPLHINGSDRVTSDTLPSLNPANPKEIIAHVCQAGKGEAEEAVRAAQASFGAWRETDPRARADYLLRAAASMRDRRHELAAWQILEIGKQWDQASADVSEAIDFLEYYAREMIRLGRPRPLPSPPGEINQYFYEPRGVAVVIAPWNFPLAISCGMVSAAIVTGNCVVYKPSPLTPVIGRQLVDAFRDAGLPAGVLNFVPCGTDVAEYLIDHGVVSTIAFTGSTQVGLNIIEKAAAVRPGQTSVKRVICEMGGKNAILIDDDADLDEAITAVLVSAFGFQGQKCSSCSRVIILESIYDRFADRLIEAARALAVGPAEDPANSLGPVCDDRARERILGYIEAGSHEGTMLYSGTAPVIGNYVPVAIFGDVRPEHRIAQEEIFGPVLALMKARDFNEALDWANSTGHALTGGVFSRSPRHLEEARRRFRVGNLYLNRHITGALVERQPFGGFKLSGLGTKAGGPEYLLHFMDPRVVTENTARRGFVPDIR